MSTGAGLGALFGAILGAVFSAIIPGLGTFLGIYIGATIGYSVGMMIDPATPDIKAAGAPLQGLQIVSNEIGSPIPDVLGTAKIAGHLLAYGDEYNVPQYTKTGGGKGGSKSQLQVTGHKYYMSWALGICKGPIDTLYTIFENEKVVWEGELNCPVLGGEETIVIENLGSMTLYFGTDDQVANSKMAGIITDPTLNSPLRQFCWAFFDNYYIGSFNRMPTMFFVFKKKPVIAFSAANEISTYDYNPMHAIWYILHDLTGLPEPWFNTIDFGLVADILFSESRGISVLIDQYQSARTYIESICNHIDGMLRYGSDGTFHPKLLRDDYNPVLLPIVDESIILEEPTVARKSWIDTMNEVKVQYSEILGRIPEFQMPASLYAWFKYNEGAGTAIIDYGPVPVNGIIGVVVNGTAVPNFWSVPGFGHNGAGGGLKWVTGYGRPAVSARYVSMVGFISPKGNDPGPWPLAGAAMWHGVGGAVNWMKLGWEMVGTPPNWIMDCSNIASGPITSSTPATQNVWHFIYMLSDTVNNITQLYTRLSGGTLILAASTPHTAHNVGNSTAVIAFGANNTNYPMDGGDMLWFTADDASGVIGVAKANEIYDELKGRYGMT